jgi:hypothetical protein
MDDLYFGTSTPTDGFNLNVMGMFLDISSSMDSGDFVNRVHNSSDDEIAIMLDISSFDKTIIN